MNIWLATGNIHKKKELAAILDDAGVLKTGGGGFGLRIPADAGLEFDPEETGSDFCENALIKARELYSLLNKSGALHRGDVVIADDSGICLDALGGRPGIFSARYAGAGTGEITSDTKKLTDSERNALLLAELGDNPLRTARFVCAMALLRTNDRFCIAQETLEGEIVKGPECAKGSGGFGYDPILFIPEFGRTVAELSEEKKNTHSHRAKAAKIIASILKTF